MTTTQRLNYASAGAVRRRDPLRIRIAEDSDGPWTVTQCLRSGSMLLFRGEHSEAVQFADDYVNI